MKEIKQLCKINSDITRSIDLCHEKIDENSALVKNLNDKIEKCYSSVEELDKRCSNLEDKNKELKADLNRQEQYSRSNCLELVGIPEVKNESVLTIVTLVAQVLGLPLTKSEVDCCHRLAKPATIRHPATDGRHRNIIIKFVNRWKKEEFIKARRVRRNLCVRELSLNIPNLTIHDMAGAVYVNESLPKNNRILPAKCREYKKAHEIQYLWIRREQTLMRKSESSDIISISSEYDLNKLPT